MAASLPFLPPHVHRCFRPVAAALPVALLICAVLAAGRAADLAPILLLDGAVTGSDVVAVGERGTILRSSDSGRTWQPADSAARATLTGVSFVSSAPRLGWAVGHDALILATTDGGRVWRRQYQGENLQDSFLDVLALDAQRVIAVGAYGLFAFTEDGGKSWTRRKISGDDYHLNRITRGPAATLYLAGEHGTLLRSTDAGSTWTPMARPYEGSFYGVLPLGPRVLVAYGLRGRVFRSIDDGASWAPVVAPEPALLATAVQLPDGRVWLAGQPRTLLASADEGLSLAPAADAPASGVAELLALPDGNVLALGEAGATVISPPARKP